MSTLVTGIAELVTNDPSVGPGLLGTVADAAVVVADGAIAWVGPAARAPHADTKVDVGGRAVIPGFVDSHAHLVFAGDRAAEFEARMSGARYDGGGISRTVSATRGASDDVLRSRLRGLVAEMRAQGTTTVEIKSGYGLTVPDEARCLRLAAEITPETTFLGAHVVPPEYAGRTDEYVGLVTGPMLAACAPHARWIDVFCEPASPHAFDGDAARVVLEAGRGAGLGVRVHANQLSAGPGVQLAAELGAASADHCTHLTPADVDALAGGTTVATLMPGVEFSTRSPYPDARRLLSAGVTVALATDCNPGSSPIVSILAILNMACTLFGLTPEEALAGVTRHAAHALGLNDRGTLEVGKRADLALWGIHRPAELSYWFGFAPLDLVLRGGRRSYPGATP